jgi:hypothetical protein
MQMPIRLGDWRLQGVQRWKVFRAAGIAILAYAGVISVVAV